MKNYKKNLLLLFASLLVSFLLINALLFWKLKNDIGVSIYDSEQYTSLKLAYLKEEASSSFAHPYYGLSSIAWHSFPNEVSTEPVFGSVSSLPSTSEIIKVLVLGGSVAANLSNGGGNTTKHLLAKLLNNHFGTDRFVVYNAAFGGGKQPQQYLRWIYLDLMGFRPDIVVNLDGFNEMALTNLDNKMLGIPAVFPRSHSRLVHATAADRSCAKLNNKLIRLDSGIPIVEYFTWSYIRRCTTKIEQSLTDKPWWSGSMGISDKTDYVAQSLTIWADSSNKLFENLSQADIDYIHVLQPNQYLDGSKIFSAEEKERYMGFADYGNIISKNYGKFNSKALRTKNFTDQRYLFKNYSGTVYRDFCCHFNQHGMEYIINDIISKNDEVFTRHLK